jgi:hypothetical protein
MIPRGNLRLQQGIGMMRMPFRGYKIVYFVILGPNYIRPKFLKFTLDYVEILLSFLSEFIKHITNLGFQVIVKMAGVNISQPYFF